MKRLFLIAIAAMMASASHAQGYGTTLGVRIGNNNDFRMGGISVKQRLFYKTTLEGIAQTDFSNNHTFHLMINQHQKILSNKLNFYFGAGIMGGIEEDRVITKEGNQTIITSNYDQKTFGADLIAGIELTLLKFNLSIDYKPNFNFTGRTNWYQSQVAISARAVIASGESWDKRERERKTAKKKAAQQKIKDERKSQQQEQTPSGIDDFFKNLFKKEE